MKWGARLLQTTYDGTDIPWSDTNQRAVVMLTRSSALGFWSLVLACTVVTSPARAEVGDPTIETDHLLYPGEGALQTIEQCVSRAVAGHDAPQDKAIALYLWMLTHQFHLMSPQEWNIPGRTPDTAKDDYDQVVYDANRARFSYAYGLCGTVHAWNEPYWKALGMNARRRAFPGHVNSEIEYGGAWHAFDTDMAGLVFRRDGLVAGYDDLIKDPKLADNGRTPLPCYPFAWPGDFEGMKQGWQQIAKGGNWYKMYHSGYAAQPGIVRLRSGETFTRYFNRDHFGGPGKRRFWHHLPGGPQRNWTFVNMGPPEHRGSESNSRGNASYANAEFVYRPDLSSQRWLEGAVEHTDTLSSGPKSPRLHGAGEKCQVTFDHFSTYVICGDPTDDANPMTGPATGGLVVSGKSVGPVYLEVSPDQGQSWSQPREVQNAFEVDLTNDVKGRYGWQVRLTWQGAGGLDELQFTTVAQVAQTIYPRLKPGGSTVVYRAGSRGVTPLLPHFGENEEPIARYEARELRSANVAYKGRGANSRLAYEVRGNKPGSVAFRVHTPGRLLEVCAAARFPIRVPPPEGAAFSLELSTDGGRQWRTLAKPEIPADNEYSSGWMYGAAKMTGAERNIDQALVRANFFGGGYQTGLMAAEIYGIYDTPSLQDLTVTYAWKENGAIKTHREPIPAGLAEHRFQVPTGSTIVDESIRIEAP